MSAQDVGKKHTDLMFLITKSNSADRMTKCHGDDAHMRGCANFFFFEDASPNCVSSTQQCLTSTAIAKKDDHSSQQRMNIGWIGGN